MKQLGNSVAISAIQEVANNLVKYIELNKPMQQSKDYHTLFQSNNEWVRNEQKI